MLDLRIYDTEKLDYKHNHYNVRTKKDKKRNIDQFYFSRGAKYDTLSELITAATDNKQEQTAILFFKHKELVVLAPGAGFLN